MTKPSKEPLQALKGMEDILPQSVRSWQGLEAKLRQVFESWGFEEIRTPVVEPIELFKRSIGEETDIVAKEMFEFKDRGERHLALRPEMTASVVRAVIEHRLSEGKKNFGLYYWGSMYRAERPQKGRKREFYQAGCEFFGESCPEHDVLLLTLLSEAFTAIGLTQYQLKINHLGTEAERATYLKTLKTYLEDNRKSLSEDSLRRLETNMLRVFDSKVPQDVVVTQKAPRLLDSLGEKSRQDLESVQKKLKGLSIPFIVEPRIVRGLDYYTGLVFEVTHPALGAQDAIGAGGRYDSLVQTLGGPALGASGFALGIERLLLSLEGEGRRSETKEKFVYFGSLSGDYFDKLHELRRQAASAGIRTEADYLQVSLKKHLGNASKREARLSVILGESEMGKGVVLVKDMASGEQREVPFDKLTETLKATLNV